MRMTFYEGTRAYVPLTLNCGPSVAPWFFTKAMDPVVAFLRRLSHRVFAYIDDLFGTASPRCAGAATVKVETKYLCGLMCLLF